MSWLRPAEIYLAVDLDLAVDLSPQRNEIDPQQIRSPPFHVMTQDWPFFFVLCSAAGGTPDKKLLEKVGPIVFRLLFDWFSIDFRLCSDRHVAQIEGRCGAHPREIPGDFHVQNHEICIKNDEFCTNKWWNLYFKWWIPAPMIHELMTLFGGYRWVKMMNLY